MAQAMSGARIRKELVRILGVHRVVHSEANRHVMVYVDSPQAASATVTFAQTHAIPILPAPTGNTPPPGDEWVIQLNLDRFNAVSEFSPDSRLASVQAGIRVESMLDWLVDRNLELGVAPEVYSNMELWEFMLDPSPGRFGPRFGQKWKQVFALKAVLPNGQLFSTSLAPARATGPDFTTLILLGRGRFGIPLELTLRLQAHPRKKHYLAFALDSLEAGIAPAWEVAKHTKPEYIELGTNQDRTDLDIPEHFILVELWGEGNRLSVRRERVRRLLKGVGTPIDIPYETLLGFDQTYGFQTTGSCQMFTSKSRLAQSIQEIEVQRIRTGIRKVRVRGFVDGHACVTVDCPMTENEAPASFHPVGVYGSPDSVELQEAAARSLDPNGIFKGIEDLLGGTHAI